MPLIVGLLGGLFAGCILCFPWVSCSKSKLLSQPLNDYERYR